MTIYKGNVRYGVTIYPGDRIEPGTTFASSVEVGDCPGFTGFPEGTTFASWVAVGDCPGFTGFPEGTTFASWVAVRNCPGFTGFPEGTTFASWVAVRNCPGFTGSPGCTMLGREIAYGDVAEARIRRVAETVLADPTLLDMSVWHSERCNTVHCMSGHGIHQEGADGYALERELTEELGDSSAGARAAGTILLGVEAAGHFYDDNDKALAWLRSKVEQPSTA